MTCDEFTHDLHEYYTGRIDPGKVDGLSEHRKHCPACDRLMTVAEEMTCKEFTELLNCYAEDRMPDGQRQAFDRHLAICPDCTAYLQSYRATMRMSAYAMKDAMRRLSDEMPADLVRAILAARVAQRVDEGN